jgi:hypothetical protein
MRNASALICFQVMHRLRKQGTKLCTRSCQTRHRGSGGTVQDTRDLPIRELFMLSEQNDFARFYRQHLDGTPYFCPPPSRSRGCHKRPWIAPRYYLSPPVLTIFCNAHMRVGIHRCLQGRHKDNGGIPPDCRTAAPSRATSHEKSSQFLGAWAAPILPTPCRP